MSNHIGLPPTPTPMSGWARVAIASGRSFLVKETSATTYTYIPDRPVVARDGGGRPRVALTLLLSRMPMVTDASIGSLIISGSLALVCTFAADGDDVLALEAQLDARCMPLFIRSGSAALRDAARVYVQSELLGTGPQFWLGTSLPAQQALGVLYAFDRIASDLAVETRVDDISPLVLAPVPFEELLGGVLDGVDRRQYVSMMVVHTDGTVTPVPALTRAIPQDVLRTRGADQPLAMIAMEQHLAAVPFALMPSTTIKPPAAALIAGGATTPGTRINAHAQYWLANDAILWNGDDDSDDTPTEHLPIIDKPEAPFWTDALDASVAWYAPTFSPVLPAAHDDPASAAFSFVYERSGTTLGPGGPQTGLTATVRITVEQERAAETTAALASASTMKPQPVALNNLSVSLEIPYRQTGSATPITQRIPGTVTQNGNRLVVSVPLLDDWVRLAYNALAYPPAAGLPMPRLVIDYAFMGYQWTLFHPKIPGIPPDERPPHISHPQFIANELAVVRPRSAIPNNHTSVQRRLPTALLTEPAVHVPLEAPAAAAGTLVRPVVRRRLLTRSLVREETVDLQFPCTSLGSLYLQRADHGTTMTSIGCQDTLKLGETATKAFEEIPALRDPAYRVYRSLQQPGRFLVVPTSYRVGRYAASEGGIAFRPMILMYGVLNADPANNRYALTATLIANISAYQFALLQSALQPYAPSNTPPTIVLPTDPFVGAKIMYAWTVPSGLDQPQALSVVDVFNVTLSMAMADALLLSTLIDHNGIQGSATFTLPDGTSFSTALTIDGDVIGPPDTGPVMAAITAGTITLINRAQQAMHVLDVASIDMHGNATVTAVNTTLAPGATFTLAAPTGTVRALVEARLATHLTIDELDVFVEDVTMTVTFINQINFASHQLTALRIRARLRDSDNIVTVDLPEGKIATATFTLPITTYLAHQTLQYALAETATTGSKTPPWRDWDLNKGTVIGITADVL